MAENETLEDLRDVGLTELDKFSDGVPNDTEEEKLELLGNILISVIEEEEQLESFKELSFNELDNT